MGPQWDDEVLVVDGAAEVRAALRDILEAEGYAVQAVPDTEEGVRVLRASPEPMAVLFGVVPLDSLTREQSGLGLLDAIGREPERLGRHAYILLTTAPEQVVAQAGVLSPRLNVTVLREPFDLDYLLRTVEEVMPGASEHAVVGVAG